MLLVQRNCRRTCCSSFIARRKKKRKKEKKRIANAATKRLSRGVISTMDIIRAILGLSSSTESFTGGLVSFIEFSARFSNPFDIPKFFLFFSKIHSRTIYNERSRQRRYMNINSAKKVEFFFSGVRNIHLRRANCVTLARLFRFLPGLLVPRISFLSTVSRFLYKHAHSRAGRRIGRQLGAHFFFKPFFDKFITILVFLLFLVFPM